MNHYDVIVVGGGAGGVGAAVGAARAGARTVLIESAGCLGGAASLRNVTTYCGVYTLGELPTQVVYGVGGEVIDRLRERGAVSGPHRFRGVFLSFDPESNKVVLDELCAEAGVEVQFHSRLIGATRACVDETDRGRIDGIDVHDHGGTRHLSADAFVDASGEADLAFLSGAAVRYGNDDVVNLGSLGTRFGGIPGDVTVTADQIETAVGQLDDEGEHQFTKRRSVVARLPLSNDLCLYVASADYDVRDVASLSAAEASGRRQAQSYLQAVRRLPGCEQAYLVSTGPEFGTRESRHLDSQRQLTWSDIEQRRRFDDCIALGAWGAEWHDRSTFASTLDVPPGGEAYEIPLRCLVSIDTENLFAAGRTADGDRKAGAAIRVMGTSLATGQAAGVAAAIGIADPAKVRDELRSQGATVDRVDLGD